MAEYEPLGDRRRASEDDYFRKRDRELIEKIRRATAAEQARRELGEKTGLQSPELLEELLNLGFTPDTVSLLPLAPVVQVAWAEGGVTAPERDLIVRLARARGIEEGTAADRQLQDWLTHRPAEAVFAKAGRLIAAMLTSGSAQTGNLTAEDLVRHCEAIAAASGGILGLGRVSGEERALLVSIAASLKNRQS